MVSTVLGDLRYTLRLVRQNPAFTLTIVLLLAAGIAATTTIFTVLNVLLLRPLPVAHPENLVRLVEIRTNLGRRSTFRYAHYLALKTHSTKLAEVFAQTDLDVAFREGGNTERLRAQVVTGNFFRSLSIPALLGRGLSPEDETRTADTPPLVLSYPFWRRWFHGNRSALGRIVVVQGQPFVIVGVMPKSFHGTSVETTPDLWAPLAAAVTLSADKSVKSLAGLSYELTGRLREGATLAQAQSESAALIESARDPEDGPERYGGELAFEVESITRGVSAMRPQFSRALVFLMGAAVLLMVMVCANVAGLLLARAAARQGEMSIKMALGATRRRLLRQLLTEYLLLSLCAAIAGWAIAASALPLLVRALPPVRIPGGVKLPLALSLDPDLSTFAFAVGMSVLSTLLFGLAPAFHSLRSGFQSVRASQRWRGRELLIAAQSALCVLLVVSTGLLLRSFQGLKTLDAGFDRAHVVTFSVDPSMAAYKGPQARALEERLLAGVRALPEVESAAIASIGLMRGTGMKITLAPTGQMSPRKDFLNSSINFVTPEYFGVMGMRLISGRIFSESNLPPANPEPVLVNQALVRRMLPGQNPLGRTLGGSSTKAAPPEFQIVGVVSDAKYRSLVEPVQPTIYQLYRQDEQPNPFILHVRTRTQPEAVIQPARALLRAIDPRLPFYEINTLASEVDASLWSEHLLAVLASIFAGFAVALGGAGIYGLMAYLVTQRRREIGIRMALGAQPGRIARWISSRVLLMTLSGALAGFVVALAAAPQMERLLYNVSPADPLTLIGTLALILAVTAAGAALPAWKAARISPAASLKDLA